MVNLLKYDMSEEVKLSIVGIYILSVEIIPSGSGSYDSITIEHRDAGKYAINYRYTSNELDYTKETFKEAIEKKQYIDNECWINTLLEVYGNSLAGGKQQQIYITRDIIMNTINKNEETIKNGISIKELEIFFIRHRLHVVVYDRFYNIIYEHKPEKRNHHNRVLYCLSHGNHIYTLDHNLKNDKRACNQPVTDLNFKDDGKKRDVKKFKSPSKCMQNLHNHAVSP